MLVKVTWKSVPGPFLALRFLFSMSLLNAPEYGFHKYANSYSDFMNDLVVVVAMTAVYLMKFSFQVRVLISIFTQGRLYIIYHT